ncbi:MAG: PQQ-binding-like beta-propeller repeat protein, partial [Desulfobacterales bacterium]|nr:PQQ-binding-like beta-propeller repeat protein [Desulfobacterales bacterium]
MIRDILNRAVRLPGGTVSVLPCGSDEETVPLDPLSPWPKFRGNSIQNGRSPVNPTPSDMVPWEFATGKGIFSSPVIDGEGTVYIGSADHYFYAITPEGKLKWRFATGEIIDSSALLDDKKRIFFGSGDGHVYGLDRETGTEIWRFAAHTTAEVEDLYDITTYNLNWFEGNTAMLADGTLLAPNDNYLVYGMDRESGKPKDRYLANEMVWSCPAVNADTGRVFFASCFNAVVNIFCYDTRTGKKIWTAGGLGSISASPLLTSRAPDGAVLVGGFDGILRALSQKDGRTLWTFGARDHIYGSPAQLSSGIIVQAACDGTVVGLDPRNGDVAWQFDTREPIRSSPVVDGEDRIYFGSGEGRLYCINKDGSFHWAYQCIEDNRSDLNGSPALGHLGVCITGENGGVFFVPYDYPLSPAGKDDPRCLTDHTPVPDGCHFFYVDHFGRPLPEAPTVIQANEPVMLAHMVRSNGRTLLSAIDGKSLAVIIDGKPDARISLSADKRFITLIPKETWTGPEGG